MESFLICAVAWNSCKLICAVAWSSIELFPEPAPLLDQELSALVALLQTPQLQLPLHWQQQWNVIS